MSNCILDHRCLRCLDELSPKEKEYWGKIAKEKTEKESTILRVQCVKCAKGEGRIIPEELKEI